ncbi:MAG: hypothetical protein AAGD96_09845 [Chloroflexota bacterium]
MKVERQSSYHPIISSIFMEELIQLKNILDDRFSLAEIKDLCFDLEVDYDDLGSGGLSEHIVELIQYLENRGQTHKLIELIAKYRPDIDLSFWSGGALDLKAKQRPAGPGNSISNGRGGAATFGCLVTHRQNPNDLYILCDGSGLNVNGLNDSDVILQPGVSDGGHLQRDVIAFLSDWTQPSPDPAAAQFNLSAAIASVSDPKEVSPQLPDGNFFKDDTFAELGSSIRGFSRENGLVNGKVLAVDSSVTVPWVNEEGEQFPVTFSGLIETTAIMVSGDSGMIIFDNQYRPIGLGFAGNDSVSLFFPLERVLDYFDVDIVTESFWLHHQT